MKTRIILCAVSFLSTLFSFGNPPVDEGKQVFMSHCAGCHTINKQLTGPALAGVDERHSMDWIISFVRSSQSVIKSGDRDAVALFEKFHKMIMPDHQDLTAGDIENIVSFIKSEAKVTAADAPPFSKPQRLHPAYMPLSINNYGFFLTFIAIVFLLAGALVALVKVKSIQRSSLL